MLLLLPLHIVPDATIDAPLPRRHRLLLQLLSAEERPRLDVERIGVRRAELLHLGRPVMRRRRLGRQLLLALERHLLDDDLLEQRGQVLGDADARVLI